MGLCVCEDVCGVVERLYCYYSRGSVDTPCVICFNVCLNCVFTELLFTRALTRYFVVQT
jgi:hypothetical protein